MYKVFNRFMDLEYKDLVEALSTACLNAACVVDEDGNIKGDFRTAESEADERG